MLWPGGKAVLVLATGQDRPLPVVLLVSLISVLVPHIRTPSIRRDYRFLAQLQLCRYQQGTLQGCGGHRIGPAHGRIAPYSGQGNSMRSTDRALSGRRK